MERREFIEKSLILGTGAFTLGTIGCNLTEPQDKQNKKANRSIDKSHPIVPSVKAPVPRIRDFAINSRRSIKPRFK